METKLNRNGAVIEIAGDYSPHKIYINADIAESLGGAEAAFHEIKRLQNTHLMPRMGSPSRPLTARDIRYAAENERRGEQYWQWRQITRGRTCFYGYGYEDGSEFVFVDKNGGEFERVRMHCH